jgi:menaquinone-dependent protoporphyrinogen oxidase
MTTTPTQPVTCDVPVFFATTEGQTRRIAERLASVLSGHGFSSRAVDLDSGDADAIDWARVRGAIVGASIHVGKHQSVARAFARTHAAELTRVPSAFFSVSLSANSSNPDERAAARRLADGFPESCGWHAAIVESLAGRLAYTRYGFLKRQLMKRIARKEGAPTDTSRDYEFTNWEKVDRLADALVGLIREHARKCQIAAA